MITIEKAALAKIGAIRECINVMFFLAAVVALKPPYSKYISSPPLRGDIKYTQNI